MPHAKSRPWLPSHSRERTNVQFLAAAFLTDCTLPLPLPQDVAGRIIEDDSDDEEAYHAVDGRSITAFSYRSGIPDDRPRRAPSCELISRLESASDSGGSEWDEQAEEPEDPHSAALMRYRPAEDSSLCDASSGGDSHSEQHVRGRPMQYAERWGVVASGDRSAAKEGSGGAAAAGLGYGAIPRRQQRAAPCGVQLMDLSALGDGVACWK